MNIKLISELSIGFLFVAFAIGLLYSFLLYYRERKNEYTSKSKKLLGFIRFLSVFSIALLLMAPMIRNSSNLIEKPIIVFAQDISESILLNKDSLVYKTAYKKNVEQLVEDLEDKYNVDVFSFGSRVQDSLLLNFNEKQTDIELLFDEIENKYANRNLGAVIFSSDGIYTKGKNPLYSAIDLKSPVYSIAMGDTALKRDVLIKDVKYNKITYLGNYFPIDIILEARKFKGKNVIVRISQGKEVIFTQSVTIKNNSLIEHISTRIEAKEVGVQKFDISVSVLDGESSKINNYSSAYIDVLDSRQKVLILFSSPHPDITAIKSSLEANENYQIESFPINEFNKSVKGYNLVILHGLPSLKYRLEKVLAEIENSDTPILFIVSSESYFASINRLRKGLSVNVNRGGVNEVKAVYNKEFSLFTLSNINQQIIEKLPPLSAPFGNYSGFVSSHVLFKQRIGTVASSFPLVVFSQNNESKGGFITGEGLWRWKLANFKLRNNHEAFNEFVSKVVQYLCIKVDKSLFRVNSKNTFNENENIEFSAELYNDSYELINEPEVELTIYNDSIRYPFVFRKTANAYYMNAGSFTPGDYSFLAKVFHGGNEFIEKGLFTVKEINIESKNTLADHHLLFNLAEKSGGKMVFPNQINSLLDLINERKDIVSISYPQKTFKEIITIPHLLVALILILSLEWFIRKWKGGY